MNVGFGRRCCRQSGGEGKSRFDGSPGVLLLQFRCYLISIALIFGFSTTGNSEIVMLPFPTVVVNVRSTAMFGPPAAAAGSKFQTTVWPFIAILNTLWPA